MKTGELILHPARQGDSPAPGRLKNRLSEIGLIGEAWGKQGARYLVGERFLRLISFLGCSPSLRLSPSVEGEGDFCQVHILGPFPEARLLSAANTRAPRCPHCGKGLEGWRRLEDVWQAGHTDLEIGCSYCGEASMPGVLDWRRKAGVSRLFVAITQVFPEEAIPLPELMSWLRGDGEEWAYFYLQARD